MGWAGFSATRHHGRLVAFSSRCCCCCTSHALHAHSNTHACRRHYSDTSALKGVNFPLRPTDVIVALYASATKTRTRTKKRTQRFSFHCSPLSRTQLPLFSTPPIAVGGCMCVRSVRAPLLLLLQHGCLPIDAFPAAQPRQQKQTICNFCHFENKLKLVSQGCVEVFHDLFLKIWYFYTICLKKARRLNAYF